MNKSTASHSTGAIARSAGIIGFATLISRILGFIRDIVIARLFGTYLYAQAFVIAFKLPNLFRDLAGEGATNAAFVPVFSDYLARGKDREFWELTNVAMNLLLVALSCITLAGIIFAPVLVRLIAPGFSGDTLRETIRLTRVIFPYILLIGLAAYSMGILNSLRHFALPAFGPCLLNISIIVCALIWGEGIRGLATGVLIGGALQLGIQVPLLHKKGFRFRLSAGFRHPAIAQIRRLLAPRLFSSAVYQLNNFVDSIFGSLVFIVGEGGVAALYFSYRLIQFPLGIFGNALAQAILPTLAHQAVDSGSKEKFNETLLFGLRSVLFIMIPASAGFIALSRPIIETLFAGGKFDAASVQITSGALLFYSIGLFAYAGVRIMQHGFFALKDTRTPAFVSALALVLNVLLNAIFMFPLKLKGLALATSCAGIANFLLLFMLLNRKTGGLGLASLGVFVAKVVAASLAMGAACYLSLRIQPALGCPGIERVLRLAIPVAIGVASYLLLCLALRVEHAWRIVRWLTRRRARPF